MTQHFRPIFQAVTSTVILLSSAPTLHAIEIIHADDDSAPGGDGLTWATPFADGCESFDFDGDLDIDLKDYRGIQIAFDEP